MQFCTIEKHNSMYNNIHEPGSHQYKAKLLGELPGIILVYSFEDGDLVREYYQNNLNMEFPEISSFLNLSQHIHSKSLRDYATFLNDFLEGKSEPRNTKIQLLLPTEEDPRRLVDVLLVNDMNHQRLIVYVLTPTNKPMRQLMEDKRNKRFLIGNTKLTQRELIVLKHIANGLKTSEIAKETERSIYTIENTKRRLFRKLKLKNVNELVRFATEYDIV